MQKNLMWKASEDVFLGYLREWVFHIFPKMQSIMGVSQIPFKIFVDVTIFKMAKNGGNWELLLTVTEKFVLNVTGLLGPSLNRIDKFRLR